MHNLLSAHKGIFEFIRKNNVIDNYSFLVKDMVNKGAIAGSYMYLYCIQNIGLGQIVDFRGFSNPRVSIPINIAKYIR